MTNVDDNQFDDNQFDEAQFEEMGEPAEPSAGGVGGSSNRVFLIGVGILGALTLLAIVGGIIFFLISRSGTSSTRSQEATKAVADNQATARAATATVAEFVKALTPSATLPPTPTNPVTPTPLLAIPTNTPIPTPTETPGPGTPAATMPVTAGTAAPDAITARTQTVAAMLTQAAGGAGPTAQAGGLNGTGTPAATALPGTGFADEVGLPMMVGMAALLLFVVFFVRRMRVAS